MQHHPLNADGYRRQYAITADDPANLPFAFKDLALIHGLKSRTDLNNKLVEAHGRIKKGTHNREGATVLSSNEEIWIPRSNLQQIFTQGMLEKACATHDVSENERVLGEALLLSEKNRRAEVLEDFKRSGGGVYNAARA
jgi:hypothetical protein